MKTYIVQLENEDDIISVKDKISWSKANRVLLVWPRRGRLLGRRLDLLLLLRHCKKLGAQLALITHDRGVMTIAREVGIPVFRNSNQAQRTAWRKPRDQKHWLVVEKHQPGQAALLRSQREALSRPKPAPIWIRLVIFILGLGAVLALGLFFAPAAVVRLKPLREPQQINLNVWANPEIQAPHPSGGIPAQVLSVTVEGRDLSPATSVALIPDDFASGSVQFRNMTDQVVDVPEGSVVMTLSRPPVRFAVTQAVQVPAGPGKTVLAAVRAVAPGSASNLPAGQIKVIEGPLGVRLTVENIEATRDGTDRSAPAPGENDYQALREKLLIKLQEQALVDLRGKLSPDQRLLEGTLRREGVTEETREPSQGQPGDQLQLSMRAAFDAWAVSEADLEKVAEAGLGANLPAGFLPVPGSLKLSFISEPQLSQTGTAGSQANGTTNARWQVRAERILEAGWTNLDLVNALRGQTLSQAKETLQTHLALAQPPEIALYPTFWQRMPYLPARITLVKQ